VDEGQQGWLQEGIAAARAGEVERARASLLRVIEADGRNVQAWYWLSRVVDDPKEREICLENVVALDPAHGAVQAELADLRRRMAEEERAALLSKASLAAAVPRSHREALIAEAAVEPLACPYCGQVAEVQARRCPGCDGDLHRQRPKTKKHSAYSLGLVVAWFALANYVWLGLFVFYLFSRLSSAWEDSVQAQSSLGLVAELLGLEGLSEPLPAWPLIPVLVVSASIFVLSLVVAWGLYRRHRAFYWLSAGLVLLYPLVAIYRVTSTGSSPWRLLIDGALTVAVMGLVFMAYDEFGRVEERLHAGVDGDVESHSALYARGASYARQGMWAKAAAHWSRAVALSPGHADYRLALAQAYVNLEAPEQAREHLAVVREMEPDHPGLGELLARSAE
jgi:tetratricopeptide (TPR) repeat protein